jgi:hypothetical protein
LEEDKDDDDDDDDDEDGRALGFLVLGRGGDGREGSLGEGIIAGFSDGDNCDVHLVNLAAPAPDASPSSSFCLFVGLFTRALASSILAFKPFSISASTSFHCSFNHS